MADVGNMDFAPPDDPVVLAEIRFGTRESVPVVFVRPEEYRKIAVWLGVQCWGNFLGTVFEVDIGPAGEFHRIGILRGRRLCDFPGATVGDFPVQLRIDWARELPEELVTTLRFSPGHLACWRALTCAEMRAELSRIKRARSEEARTRRTLALVDRLGSLSEGVSQY